MLGDSNNHSKRGLQHSDVLLHSSSVQVSLTLAEPTLFLYGFSKNEYGERPPALIRGSLTIRVFKPIKLKGITLRFSGVCRTEWPEGIPPEKTETCEINELYSNTWEFFNAQTAEGIQSSCAHEVRPLGENENSLSSVRSTNALEAVTSVVTRGRSGTTESSNNSHELKHYRVFQPAEYIYNIELLLPQRMPETIKANFGSIRWLFHLNIDRHGTFKSNWSVTREIRVLRALGLSNLETSEPIVISRDWESALHYEIVIAGKAFSIGSEIPIAITLVPLAKVKCHRIRSYITEHVEYYCKNRRVHRVEPAHKFLLLEETPKERGGSLIEFDGSLSQVTEIERTVQIPRKMSERREVLRANSNSEYIKVYHWIKIVMRLSRLDTPTTESGRTKCYEISIDSPVTLIERAAESANLLPAYGESRSATSVTSELRPYQDFVNESDVRPIHYMRQPSVAPPPFDADTTPPKLLPPEYDTASAADYEERYHAYLNSHHLQTPDVEDSSSNGDSASASSDRIPDSSQNTERTSNEAPQPGEPHFSEIIWRTDSDTESNARNEGVEDEDPLSTVPDPESQSPVSPVTPSSSSPGSHQDPPQDPVAAQRSASPQLHTPSISPNNKTSLPSRAPLSAGNMSRLNSLSLRSRGMALPSPGPSRRPSASNYGSVKSAGSGVGSGRYYRQSSIVSMDLADRPGSVDRRASRVSNVTPMPGWYPLSRNNSDGSLNISISEYQSDNLESTGPHGYAPLLGSVDSNADMGAQYGDWDLEDDGASIVSGYYNITAP